jgi:hypothetical protein
MKILWTVMAGAMLIASQASAATPAGGERSVCVPRATNESEADWLGRTRSACQIRWDTMVTDHTTGGWTHRSYIDACTKKCGFEQARGTDFSSAGPFMAGGLLAAGVIGLSLSKGTTEQPTSP